MIDLSIIVPTRNVGDTVDQIEKIKYSLGQCLSSLLETIEKIPIIVASNGGDCSFIPSLESAQKDLSGKVAARIKRINLWEQGQCKAVNAAVATTNTEWIMVTNDDMIYSDYWLQKVTYMLPKEIECFSPKLVEPNTGAPTFIKYFCGGAGGDFDKQKFLDFANQREDTDPEIAFQTGFNLPFIIKRDLWDKIGGYDINYDPWSSNSDSDLEYKIRLAGVQPYQNQNSLVYHFSQTSGTFHPDHHNMWEKNYQYFIDKWGFKRADAPEIWTADFEIPYEELKYRPEWAIYPNTTRGKVV